MLKWTASAQRLTQETPTTTTEIGDISRISSIATMRTPAAAAARRKNRRRRATIANKENIPAYTSTPMVPSAAATLRTRNSPLVLAPLMDILNVTPEPVRANTPEQRAMRVQNVYAATLPRYEEEYSPSTATMLPSGQHLALRGLLPLALDPFMHIGGNTRYFMTPPPPASPAAVRKSLPKKRKLEQEFADIVAQDVEQQQQQQQQQSHKPTTTTGNTTVFSSTKMGDQTLDKLIDAILDSACKEEKKKKSRKSFNLRRRTLLKNQVENISEQQMLSPSYAAGDDPASDLSFLLCEPRTAGAQTLPATPEPATPLPGTPIPQAVLVQMPTPRLDVSSGGSDALPTDTFTLQTPVRPLAKKRRRCQQRPLSASMASPIKKFKVDDSNYFEIGLALPSIYV